MKDWQLSFLIFVAVSGTVILSLNVIHRKMEDREAHEVQACEAKGGAYVHGTSTAKDICLKRAAVIE